MCKDWLTQFHVVTLAILALTLFIAGDNATLRVLLRELAAIEGKHTST